MHNNFSKSDFSDVKKLLNQTNPILTQSKKVEEFEKKWSKWLGVRYSTFVSSGSSANYISISILKVLNKNKYKNEIIVPTLTWISDISSIILNGFKPVFVDINLENLSMDIDQVLKKINKRTLGIFITHAQGFNGLNDKLLKAINKHKLYLIEDVCESHGATYKNKKLGTFGLMSNFSFYYAHHMTTIEGGMISTNNKEIYELSKIFRSHGMARESKNQSYENKLIKKFKNLSPQFIFLYPTLNFRNNEIGACIGINQLKKLNENNRKRKNNLKYFLNFLDGRKYWKNFDQTGSSNYAFPIILQSNNIKKRDYFEKILTKKGIEFRRGNAGGGNQLRQPYLKEYVKKINLRNFPNVEKVHFFGYYIGNFPDLSKKKIDYLLNVLNRINL